MYIKETVTKYLLLKFCKVTYNGSPKIASHLSLKAANVPICIHIIFNIYISADSRGEIEALASVKISCLFVCLFVLETEN